MISLKEALVRKNRSIDVRAVQKEAIYEKIKKDFNTTAYEIIDDGTDFIVNISDSITIENKNIKKITDITEGLYKLGYVKYLTIYRCINLESLEGCPESVDQMEIYKCPKLNDLKGITKNCQDCLLEYLSITSLEGLGDDCETVTLYGLSQLKTLEYIPKHVRRLRLYGMESLKKISNIPSKLDELLVAWCPLKLSDFNIQFVSDLKGKYDPYNGIKLDKDDFKGRYNKCNIFKEESPF